MNNKFTFQDLIMCFLHDKIDILSLINKFTAKPAVKLK